MRLFKIGVLSLNEANACRENAGKAHASASAITVAIVIAVVGGRVPLCVRLRSALQPDEQQPAHAAAVFMDKIWLVDGVSTSYYTKRLEKTTTRSDVVYSSDGATWVEALEEAPFRRRFGHSLTTFTDQHDGIERLLLIAGFSPEPATDIWMTVDGETWTEVTAQGAAPWAGRGYHCSVVFAKKLWILGGSPMNNGVWSTTSVLSDPVCLSYQLICTGDSTWEQQQNVPWSPRAAHACASHTIMKSTTLGDASREEFLFVVGGWRETSMNDVWEMDAAGSWTQLTEAALWKKRAWHSVVSFDSRTIGDVTLGPRLWLLGGGVVGNGITKMFPYSDV
ncbi:hypothetical protein FI667_g1024, partial [Globisporangium splendens]